VTCDDGFYESGAYDVRSTPPRTTAVARLLGELAGGTQPSHPALAEQGYWRRTDRHMYPVPPEVSNERPACNPVLIVGSTGTLGCAFAIVCRERGLAYELVGRSEIDITNAQQVEATLERIRPWAVINAAGYVRVDEAEHDQAACYHANTTGAVVLATSCAERGLPYVTFSSDLVFDGNKPCPYVEDDDVSPLGVYGSSKAAAERSVLLEHPEALVIRTSAFFGPWDAYNFVTNVLRDLANGMPVTVADDAIVSPTYIPDLVNTSLDLLIDGEHGRWHLANAGAVSWATLARHAAELAGLQDVLVQGRPTDELGLVAPRPRYSVLGSTRGHLLPALDDALSRFILGSGMGWQT
jgi:dTDP-4-dehydrorhamnose reductase